MRARVAPLVVAAVTVLTFVGGACSSDDDSADPTLPTAPVATTTTPTTQPADPYAIPEVIDEAYVNRVLAELYRLDGDVLRRVVSEGQVPNGAQETLRAIYNDPQFELELEGVAKTMAKGLDRYKKPPGDRIARVVKLVAARRDCVFAEVALDFSNVVVAPPPSTKDTHVLALEPTQSGADPRHMNITPWSISYTEVVKAGQVPQEQRCGA